MMGKSKELGEDQKNIIVDLHKSGKSLGAISKQLQIPRSSVQTIVRKYKILGCVTTLPRSGRRPVLSLSDERKLVWMFKNNPGTTLAQACHELESAGTPASLSTVKRVLCCHGLRMCEPRKKLLLQKSDGSKNAVRVKDEPQVQKESPDEQQPGSCSDF